jgi:hypothetical protein
MSEENIFDYINRMIREDTEKADQNKTSQEKIQKQGDSDGYC